MSSISEAIAHAAPTFSGQWLQPGDSGYEERRRVHNGLIDKRPAAIADIVAAVGMARTLGLEVSVRGGGHNVAGRATIDGGLMIDLSPMKGVFVDVCAGTVRAQGSILWRELNRETRQSLWIARPGRGSVPAAESVRPAGHGHARTDCLHNAQYDA